MGSGEFGDRQDLRAVEAQFPTIDSSLQRGRRRVDLADGGGEIGGPVVDRVADAEFAQIGAIAGPRGNCCRCSPTQGSCWFSVACARRAGRCGSTPGAGAWVVEHHAEITVARAEFGAARTAEPAPLPRSGRPPAPVSK
ncbi:hypothetical protein ACIO14_02315 [Nocardia fluminea]|uniref:hypothetical protein n=1 Tax=Nocardia fluminea TaxID=134984 RepID=UPI0038246E84